MLPFPPLLFPSSLSLPHHSPIFSPPFPPFLSCRVLPSFQAWPSGDNMFRGDKQARAAAEGSLGEAVVVCAVACVATRGRDKSPAVGGGDCLHRIVFRDTRCTSQRRWSLCGWMARCPGRCTSRTPTTALICKNTDTGRHWRRVLEPPPPHHGGTAGHGSSSSRGQGCCAQRCRH